MNLLSKRPAPAGPRGVTVVEGIFLLLILSVIAVLILSELTGVRHRGPDNNECRSNLRQIGLGFELYLSDYGRHKHYPPGGSIALLNNLYLLGRKPILKDQFSLLDCPDRTRPRPNQTQWNLRSAPIAEPDCDYLLKAGGSETESAILATFAADEPIGIDKEGNHRGEDGKEESANVLFFDTHVETVTNPSKIADYRRRVLTPGPTQ